MTELIVNGQPVTVSEDFLSLSPQEQEATIDEIASSIGSAQSTEPALSQLNLGIADAVGGLIDFVNPLDTPAVSQALGMGDSLTTGSARQGLVNAMGSLSAVGEDRAPDGMGEALLRGSGQAAGALIPTAGAANLATRAPGLTGAVATQVQRGLSSGGAVTAEVAAGGASGGAMQAASDAGLPDWALPIVGMAAPLGLAGATLAGRETARGLSRVSPINNVARATAATIAPYTRRGADAVARGRMEDLVGGRERAMELGERINPNDEFGLSPAQQTGDQNLLALEQAAAENPNVRARLDTRFAESMGVARGAVDEIGGDVGDAQAFLRDRRDQYTTEMRSVAEQAMRNAEARLQGVEATRNPADNSTIVMEEVGRAFDAARVQERALWEAVPVTRQIGVGNARTTAQRLASETGDALQGDIPPSVRQFLLNEETAYTGPTTVRNLHALYSSLRQTAREASAGQAPNSNRARVANAVADAILEDLGAVEATTDIGRAINDARAFSRAIHETFDRGAYGRLSRQNVQGDTVTDPRVALDRSVGRGGTGGMVDAENLETAAAGLQTSGSPATPNGEARGAIVDYVRGRFADGAFRPNREGREVLSRRGAVQFIRSNRAVLERYPELRQEILAAVEQQQTADELSATITSRMGVLEDARRSATSGFIDATQETAIRSIIEDDNPARAAQVIVNAARRDETGAALEGVQAVFSDDLIRRALRIQNGAEILDADAMLAQMNNPRFRSAMSRVLEPDQVRRLERVIEVVQSLNTAQTRQPSLPGQTLSGAQAPRLIQFVARIAGAQVANNSPLTQGGGAGVGLQAAQMGSSVGRDLVSRLTADRASQILADAVTDPRLFQSLLLDPASPRFEREALPRLIPYLVGGSSASAIGDDRPGPMRMELTDPGNLRRMQGN